MEISGLSFNILSACATVYQCFLACSAFIRNAGAAVTFACVYSFSEEVICCHYPHN